MLLLLLSSLSCITLINIIAYLWAYKNQSDHLTDISYSACFVGLILFLFFWKGDFSIPKIIVLGMVIIWGIRLGGFLFYRIHKMGKDERFDDFRGSWLGFLKFWILQSISIWIISLPFILFLAKDQPLDIAYWGIIIWLGGWILETVADAQKFDCKQKNPQQFISTGVFSRIRHPNYLGEILVWLGIFITVSPVLSGWEWLSIISPLWVIILLIFVSGIPLIEKKYKEKYVGQAAFDRYLEKTDRLIPFVY